MTSRGDTAAFVDEFEFYHHEQNAAQLIITPQGETMRMKRITTFKIILNNPETGEADIFYETEKDTLEGNEIPPVKILCEEIVYSPQVLMLKGVDESVQGVTIEIVF